MVYKKFIKRGGKKFGPYYYESYRDKSGIVKTRYVESAVYHEKNTPINVQKLLGLFSVIFVIIAFSFVNVGIKASVQKTENIGASIFGFANSVYYTITGMATNESNDSVIAPPEALPETPSDETEIIDTDKKDNNKGGPPADSKQEEKDKKEKKDKGGESEGGEPEEPVVEIPENESEQEPEAPEAVGLNETAELKDATPEQENFEEENETAEPEQEETFAQNETSILNQTEKEIIEEGVILEQKQKETNTTNTIPIVLEKTEELSQQRAMIGEKVKWTKKIIPSGIENATLGNFSIDIPAFAESVKIKKINKKTGEEEELTGAVSEPADDEENSEKSKSENYGITGNVIKNFIVNLFASLFSITGRLADTPADSEAVIEINIQEIVDADTEFEIEYYTPAPYSEEIEIDKGLKEITIVGPDEIHYTNVLAFTNLSLETSALENITLLKTTNEDYESVNFTAFDKDNNTLYDYIEWNVESLSEQNYSLDSKGGGELVGEQSVGEFALDNYYDLQYTNQTAGTLQGARILAPVLYMDFNDENSSIYVPDKSQTQAFGIVHGNATWTSNGGYNGKGAYRFFTSTSQIYNIPRLLDKKSEATMSVWINIAKNISYAGVLVGNSGNSEAGISLNETGTGVRCDMGNGASITYAEATTLFESGDWHNVVCSWKSGENIRIYVDGVWEGNSSVTLFGYLSQAEGFIIGFDNDAATRLFNGTIDELKVFDVSMNDGEVSRLYNNDLNENNEIGAYSSYGGDFDSYVYYNSTQTYWNITMDIETSNGSADTYNFCKNNPDCIAYWSLDDRIGVTGSTGVGDDKKSGIYNVTKEALVYNTSGISSGALGLTNEITTTMYVVPDYNELEALNFTVTGWLKDNTNRGTGTYSPLVTKGVRNNWIWYVGSVGSSAGLFCKVYQSNSGNAWLQAVYADYRASSQYDFVGCVINGTNATLYLNGKVVASSITTAGTRDTSSTGELYIGTFSASTNYTTNGSVDEILYFNKSLGIVDINNIYRGGLSEMANTSVYTQVKTAHNYNISDPNLIGFWALNENMSGNTTDEKGRYNGTCYGVNCSLWAEDYGIVGGGYSFDGINDMIDFGDISEIDGLQKMTISVWVKKVDVAKPTAFISKMTNNKNGMFLGETSTAGRLYFGITNEGSDYCYTATTSPNIITENNWYHVVGVYDGTQAANTDKIKIYVNGMEVPETCTGTILESMPDNDVSLIIGSTMNGSYNYSGSIDEVRVYNRTLLLEEITDLYKLGSMHVGDWSDWSSEMMVTKDIAINFPIGGKFMQFKTLLKTNETYASPFVLWQNITGDRESPLPPPGGNNPPAIAEIILNSTNPLKNNTRQNLTCYVNVTDADGGDVYVNYSWLNNSADAGISGQAGPFAESTLNLIATLHSGNLTAGENWTCSALAWDGTDYGTEWVNSSNMTILRAPAIYSNISFPIRGQKINYTAYVLNVTVNFTGLAEGCNATINASGLAIIGDVMQELGALGDGNSTVFQINLTDAENIYNKTYVINISTICADDAVYDDNASVNIAHNWSMVNQFINATGDGNVYDIGDYIRMLVKVKRDGVLFNLTDDANIVYNISNSEDTIVNSTNISAFRRVGQGLYYSKTYVSASFRDSLFANEQYHVKSNAYLYNPLGDLIAQQAQADYDTNESHSLIVSSSLYSYSSINTSENSVINLSVNNSYSAVYWNSTELDLSDYNPLNLDSAVILDKGFVYVNSSGFPSLNSTPYAYEIFIANITMTGVDCSSGILYYGDNATKRDVIAGQIVCDADMCRNKVCSNGILTFDVSHFTGYAYGTNSNLTIWDENDTGMAFGEQEKYVGELVKFFANFTNVTDSQIIADSNCSIWFNDTEIWENMTWNISESLLEYNRTFDASGTYLWNVTCNSSLGFDNLTANDTIPILPTICPDSMPGLGTADNPCNVTACKSIYTPNFNYALPDNIISDGTIKKCINITADNVTLDLNGYNITGIGVTAGDYYGIYSLEQNNITIKNGRIERFRGASLGEGIYVSGLAEALVQNILLDNLTISEISDYGIELINVNNSIVSNSFVENISNNDGIILENVINSQFFNITSRNSKWSSGLWISGSINNTFNNITFYNNSYGLILKTTTQNNTFINLFSYNNSENQIDDTTTGESDNFLVYNNSFGEIRWSKTDLTTLTELVWEQTIFIANNSAYYNASGVGANDRLNSSANVTLRGLRTDFGNPAIMKDGVACGGACYAFTSLNAGEVVFNVSSWSNYSIAEGSAVTSCVNLSSANMIYTLQNDVFTEGTCFNITADNVTLDGQGYSIFGENNSVYAIVNSGNNYNLSIVNVTIRDFGSYNSGGGGGIYLIDVNISVIENISMIVAGSSCMYLFNPSNATIRNNNISGGCLRGIWLVTGYNSTISANRIENTSDYGIRLGGSYNLVSGNFINMSAESGTGIGTSSRISYSIFYNNSIYNFDVGLNLESGSDNNNISNSIITLGISNGVLIANSNNTFIAGNDISKCGSGLTIIKSSNNTLIGNNIRNHSYTGVDMQYSSSNNSFINNNISESVWTIVDEGLGVDNYLSYNNSFGEIKWTGIEFLSNLNLKGDLIFASNGTIQINNNSVYVNATAFTSGLINSSVNITLNNLAYRGNYPLILRKIVRDNLDCGVNCTNATSLLTGDTAFNASYAFGNYSVDMKVRSQTNVSLSAGWNMISLTMETNTTGDRNISLSTGWNLIGFSSDAETIPNDTIFTNSSGIRYTFENATRSMKLQKYISYMDSDNASSASGNSKKYKFVGKSGSPGSSVDTKMKKGKGYWIYANESGNLTIVGAAGSSSNETYRWSDLMFRNASGTEMNITKAATEGWISNSINSLYFWDPTGGPDGTGAFDLVYAPDSSTRTAKTFYSWDGVLIYGLKNNITMLRQN